MERKISPKIIGLILAVMIFLAFGNAVSAFNVGDTVEVQNTGEIGLNARDSPAGDPTGWRKSDGDIGVILEGPQTAAVGGITYTWWKMRWSDSLEGWSAGGYPEGVYYLKVITTPSPPTLVSPSNGATGESLTPTFQWNSISNADYYGLYISEPPYGPSNLVFDSEVDYGPIYGTSFTLPSGILNNGVKYYWNMRSHNSAGWGQQFSSSWYFTTEDTPTTTTTTTSTTTTTTSSTTITTTSTTTTTTVSGETTTTTTTTTTTSTTTSTTTTTSFTTTTTLNLPPNSPQTELITVSIDDQSAIPKEVRVGESSTLKFSFTNTGNIPWTFYAAVSLRKPNGDEENLPTKPVRLSPNKQGSAEWTYTVDRAGNWDVVFGVWEEAEQENSLGYTGWLDGYIKGVTTVLQADYPGAELIPTDNKYTRDTREIRYIVIHYMDGTLAGTIDWFKRPESEVSAHYLVGETGRIVQMVKEKDIAWHAGDFNEYSIGIEHEDKRGGLTDTNWATEEVYQSSAALVRYLSKKYDIPKDRTHIIGHSEISKSGKQDPGPYWDWDYYMQLVKGETLPSTCTVDSDCSSDEICVTGQCIVPVSDSVSGCPPVPSLCSNTGPTISSEDLANLVRKNFPTGLVTNPCDDRAEDIQVVAYAIARAESYKGKPSACSLNADSTNWVHNPNQYDPSYECSVGLWQIFFAVHRSKTQVNHVIERLFDPEINADVARDIYDKRRGSFWAWSVYNGWDGQDYCGTLSYRNYIPEAKAALQNNPPTISTATTTTTLNQPPEIIEETNQQEEPEAPQPEKSDQASAQPATPAMNEIEKVVQPVIETVQDIINKIRNLFGF